MQVTSKNRIMCPYPWVNMGCGHWFTVHVQLTVTPEKIVYSRNHEDKRLQLESSCFHILKHAPSPCEDLKPNLFPSSIHYCYVQLYNAQPSYFFKPTLMWDNHSLVKLQTVTGNHRRKRLRIINVKDKTSMWFVSLAWSSFALWKQTALCPHLLHDSAETC